MTIGFVRIHFIDAIENETNLMNTSSDRYSNLGIKHTKATSTRVHIINNNCNNYVNHKMSRLLNIDTKSNNITWKARHLMLM